MQLDFNREEVEELRALVEGRIGEMSSEIRHAMVTDYREELKSHKALLEELALKLRRILGNNG